MSLIFHVVADYWTSIIKKKHKKIIRTIVIWYNSKEDARYYITNSISISKNNPFVRHVSFQLHFTYR